MDAEVAALPEPDQDLWRHRAETLRWSKTELRGGFRRAGRKPPRRPELVSISVRVAPQREQALRKAAAVAGPAPATGWPRRATPWRTPRSARDEHSGWEARASWRREPVPADRRVRLPLGLRDHARWSRRAGTSSGCACRAWTRRACSARSSTATPAASGSGPADVDGARRRAATCPGTMVLETSWGTRSGWVIVRDVAADRPLAPRGRALAAPTGARRPTTTPTTCCCARVRCVNGEVADPPRLRAGVRLRRASAASWEYAGAGYHEAIAAPRACDARAAADHRPAASASRARARRARTLMKEGDVAFVALVVVRARAAAAPTRRPTSGWSGPPTTGSTGSTTASFPDHPWRTYLQRSR